MGYCSSLSASAITWPTDPALNFAETRLKIMFHLPCAILAFPQVPREGI
jgi:hypothetical protein